MIILSLRADFHGSPLAFVHGPGATEYIQVEDFPIPTTLLERIQKWDEDFQSTLAPYPPDSKFSSAEEDESHYQEGLAIAKDLAYLFSEKYRIQYYVNGRGKIFVNP